MEVLLLLLSVPVALAGGFALDSVTNDDHAPEDAAPDGDDGIDRGSEPII